jgi:hypothetical protein
MSIWTQARRFAPLAVWCLAFGCLAITASANPSDSGGCMAGSPPLARSKRTAESQLNVALGIKTHRVNAGGVVHVRIENRGSSDVVSNLRYALARRQNDTWVALPTGPFFAPQIVVRAGTSGEWQSIRILRQARAGLYRVQKWVRAAESQDPRSLIQATFRVRAA